MSLVVEFEELPERGVVAARISGAVELAPALDALRELAARARERRRSALLLDFRRADRAASKPSIVSVYNAIKALAKRTGMSRGQRLAVLVHASNHDAERVEFLKRVQGNWGAPRFDFFEDEGTALEWLGR